MKDIKKLLIVALTLALLILPGILFAQQIWQIGNYSSQRISSYDRTGANDDGNWKDKIKPNETRAIAEVEGPGIIKHIWITIASNEMQHLKKIVMRIYWDGEETPSVEAPIGDFFGLGLGKYFLYDSKFLSVGSERALNTSFEMPFKKSAKITITNEGEQEIDAFYYNIDWEKHKSLPENTAYFHAQYRQETPTVGELSVSYNKFIKKWILLYNCGQPRGINCRTADNPWGPWSDPFVIFEPRQDQGYCYFIHSNWEVETCDNVHDPGRENEWGGEYGPYQFETLAKGDSSKTTIYYTLSTWNPYTVVLMKSKLKYKDAIISGIGDEIKGSSNNRLKIYPNPANEKLTIEFTTKSEGLLNVRFYDLQGRNVLEQKINSHSGDKRYEIRTRGLQSGLYFIKVRRSDGSNLLTKRIQIIK